MIGSTLVLLTERLAQIRSFYPVFDELATSRRLLEITLKTVIGLIKVPNSGSFIARMQVYCCRNLGSADCSLTG